MFKKLKMKNKKAFTLLEIVIVIVIIWILMSATMKFGGDRIWFLNNKNIKEQFLDSYSLLQSNNTMTNYYLWKIYKNLDINFDIWSDKFAYKYNLYDSSFTWQTYVDGGSYQINKLNVDWKNVSNLNISMTPYVLWCTIQDQNSAEAELGILVNNSKQYCFKINSDICRIVSISCE